MSFAENTPKVVLDTNESIFTVFTAINACGYDTELSLSDPLREQIRGEVAKAVAASSDAHDAVQLVCQFYADHQLPDASRNLAQYVSLALYLGEAPTFALRVKEADLPPDASRVLGIVPFLQQFYTQAQLHAIWLQHAREYTGLTERYHEPLAKMLFDTEIYLKLPSSGYLGHQFIVYLEPMGAPGQSNARNYGLDYYVVISPGKSAALKMEQIRHTYLHYLLDPLAMKYPYSLKRLDPILVAVKPSPMDENFKSDAALLVTECLIRAVEARTLGSSKTPEAERSKAVQESVEQGFVLTPYFYQQLEQFEKGPIGLRNAFPDMLSGIDVGKEQKAILQVHFASKADPELLHLTRPNEGKLLRTAEQKLAAGDPAAAQALAQQALDEKSEDSGRALFILAQVAAMKKDMAGAQTYFERALQTAHEPKVVAWSHIYLGRIYDLQEEREQALNHYRAAMSAGAVLPEIKAAAEQGLSKPYEPPAHPSNKPAEEGEDEPK
ncbi:MAG: tetratricopeptide repeat protein [Acidobacteria bacterium]|nr:tetratricopeptide repeat protein [Acidobacteriota bacterium]